MGLVRRGLPTQWILRTTAAVAVAVTFGYMPYHIYARSGFARYLELEADLVEMQRHNRELRHEIEKLGREAAALREDPRAVERVARQELGWVRPGDLVLDLREGRR